MTLSTPTPTIRPDELVGLLDSDERLFLLDVREPDEVAEWKIPGVHNVPIDRLNARVGEVPAGADVVVICAAGTRAERAAAILADYGVASRVLEGGMSAWGSTYDTVAEEVGGAVVVQVRRRGKGCLSYVIGAADRAVVIDPSLDVELYRRVASERGWAITHVLDTHLHADHLSGARDLATTSGAVLLLNPADPFTFDFEPLRDGLRIELAPGVALSVEAVSVPGHTEGSTMYRLGDVAVFTGDTLFLESVGRPDLADQAEPFAHHLFHSLHERILPLSDDVMVFPAHFGPSVAVHAGRFVASRLGALRPTLPALALGEDDFVAWAIAHVTDRPPNYRHIVLINMGREAMSAASGELELGPNRCAIA